MKKVFSLLLLLAMALCASCGKPATEESDSDVPENDGNPHAIEMIVDYFSVYPDAESVVAEADRVFIGKITSIDFVVLDLLTGEPPTEETSINHRELHSIYTLETSTHYKGESQATVEFLTMGGVPDYRMEEQIDLLQNTSYAVFSKAHNVVPVVHNMPSLVLGKTYLFAVKNMYDGYVGLFSLQHCIYDLDDPYKLHGDEITAKKVISNFGTGEWLSFWFDWKFNRED